MLLEKIEGKRAKIAVIGLGYVGLPLAVESAKAGYKVIGLDIEENRISMINKGINYIKDVANEDLVNVVKEGYLRATIDYSVLENIDCVIICVPTPIDKYKQPNIIHIKNATKEIAEYLHKDMLVILESTTYPGTTEELLLPTLESTGLKCGEDFYLAYSPERIDPGNKEYSIKNTTKVVGGITIQCTEMATALYENIFDCEVYKVSSPKVGEMGKILENTYRKVNIAMANEMAIICHILGVSVWEVIDAAKTKPYGFQAFYPGPGVGGHCIPIDPHYLMWKVKEYNYYTKLIELADEINSSMPNFILDRVIKLLNKENKSLNGSKILVLGVAYKQDIDDIRESPALKVMDLLEKEGASVEYHDPFVPELQWREKVYKSIELTKEKIQDKDLILITTGHTVVDYNMVVENARLVFDTKNITKNIMDNRERIVKL